MRQALLALAIVLAGPVVVSAETVDVDLGGLRPRDFALADRAGIPHSRSALGMGSILAQTIWALGRGVSLIESGRS